MAKFSRTFEIVDIFNNRKLKDKLPLINYREKEDKYGRSHYTTNLKSVGALIYDTAISGAKPCYAPLEHSKTGDTIIIGGTLKVEHDEAVQSIYDAIMSKRVVLKYTANNMDIIRCALKEGEKLKRQYGLHSKLYLRTNSMQEIEGMSMRQIQALMTDIMDNIFYSDYFPETQKKYGVEHIAVNSPLSYEQRKQQWQKRVGQ